MCSVSSRQLFEQRSGNSTWMIVLPQLVSLLRLCGRHDWLQDSLASKAHGYVRGTAATQ